MNITTLLLLIAVGYFILLLLLSRITGGKADNDAFFRGNRQSPWWAVCFGMLGASVSGVTFVSVPGMVMGVKMTYLQMCLGFIIGYFVVAFLLLPIYYKLNLTSIYTFLNRRFSLSAYRTGACFFFFSKITGASIRLYLVCIILQQILFQYIGIPFEINALILLTLIWLYTRGSGIRTIVWSDCLQTLVLLSSLVMIIISLCSQMNLSLPEAAAMIKNDEMSRIFVFDDVNSKQYFWKLFLSGIFTVIVMTGLDQDMMQKNLTCRTLKKSQLNMCLNGFLYLPANFLFLCLGVMLVLYCRQTGFAIPESSDELLPALCGSGILGNTTLIAFALGIIAAAFSSADSAITSLTTCCCVDIFGKPDDERLRRKVHPLITLVFFLFILLIKALNNTSVIDAVYVVCSYTYGPLLGLFSMGIFTRKMPHPKFVPWICLVSPVITYGLNLWVETYTEYHFGYELLLCNGLITFVLLLLSSTKLCTNDAGSYSHI